MTIGLCYIQQLPASVGREGLAGRLLVDHLRREFEVVICDGVFDSPPMVSSAEHLLVDDFLARRFDAVYIEGGAFWGDDADAGWKVPETVLRSFVADGGVLIVADVGRNEAGRRRDRSPYEHAYDLFGAHFDWGDDGSSITYGADERSSWNGRATSVIAVPRRMLYEPWLGPAYEGIDQILAVQPVVLRAPYASPLITGNQSTSMTLRCDMPVDGGWPFLFGYVRQLGLGFVVFIAAAVSHDVIIEANPDNARWISNIVSFLADEASRERERRGGLDPLRGPRTLQHAEWTAELGGLAQLHNDVEQRTRELVQRTLLAEERHRGEHGWAEQTIILAIPERDRERVGSGSADQLLSRLYWTDLIAIIGRQWRLFGRIFGDRNELRHKAQVVNDRAHAHAKPLDVADLALYRRELGWFKAKLDQAAARPSGGGSSA
jgi:hypothetical protein